MSNPPEESRPVMVVMGGTRGIGRAIVLRAIASGYRIATCARKVSEIPAELCEAASDGSFVQRVCDVRSTKAVANFVEEVTDHFGRIDVAVLCAGINVPRGLEREKVDLWRDAVDANVSGCAASAALMLPVIRKSPRGALILIGSVVGSKPSPASIYSVTKAAVSALSESLRRHLRESGDQSTIVCLLEPGWVDTSFLTNPRVGALSAGEIAKTVMYVLDRPSGVEIRRLVIAPTAQYDY